jgi:hypothetical protein
LVESEICPIFYTQDYLLRPSSDVWLGTTISFAKDENKKNKRKKCPVHNLASMKHDITFGFVSFEI